MDDLKLTIELIPQKSWYNNLRSLLPKEAWETLRKKIVADAQHRCIICGEKGALHCHEVWTYDDTNHIQTLTSIIPLCKLCHAVKHIGYTRLKSREYYDTVVEHFMKVNNCKRMTFETHRIEAFMRWEYRSQFEWRIDIGEYQGVNSMI